MRILWHSAHPDMPTGYAQQTALLVPRLAKLGHDISISATAGQESRPGEWRGFKVWPKTPYEDFGQDTVLGHYQGWEADLCVTLMCVWPLNPAAWRDLKVLHLTPVDCEPMCHRDYAVIENSGGMPAAISRFGERMMQARELDPLYLPHGIDTSVFHPSADRAAARRAFGLDGRFVVGMNFMNNDPGRKNPDDQIRAFAAFHKKHPDAVLLLHALQALPGGLNLPALVHHLGLDDAVRWTDQYQLACGMATPEALATWYATQDVYLGAGNEGFGLPAVEAQACGTPVILGNYSTGPELVGPGWLVNGQRKWNNTHQADWHVPFQTDLLRALDKAYAATGGPAATHLRAKARRFAEGYDIDTIVETYWRPVLDAVS